MNEHEDDEISLSQGARILAGKIGSLTSRHTDQPVIIDSAGVRRFQSNQIVRWLLDAGPFDMNVIAVTPFSDDDRQHFLQLIGYSLDGYQELGYVSDEDVERTVGPGMAH